MRCSDFDLSATLKSGQLFRWKEKSSGLFYGWISEALVSLSQRDGEILCEEASAKEISRFFSLDVDLKSIALQVDRDEIIHEALTRYWGLRVVRQEPWECLVSFILSSFNNIPRLTGMIEHLCLRFGDPTTTPRRGACPGIVRPPQRGGLTLSSASLSQEGDSRGNRARAACGGALGRHPRLGVLAPGTTRGYGGEQTVSQRERGRVFILHKYLSRSERESERWPSLGARQRVCESPYTRGGPVGNQGACYRFPTAQRLAGVSQRALRNCGLGFRAPYIKEAAQAVASGKVNLEGFRGLEDEPLRRALLEIPGVGEKVVECVMLFAYERGGAFPVDVWIGRAMRGWYFRARKVTDRQVREFARRYFGPFCGWAQQYLYCLAREGSSRVSLEATVPSGRIS